jgi:Fungal Zn(2)-Cys(6) binuclear cluster domain/Fungal specific transcription factor domain
MEPATAAAAAAVAAGPVPVPVYGSPSAPLQSPTATSAAAASANPSTSPSSEGDQQGERQASLAASTSSSSRPDQNKERITVPSACVQCRSKHLKCDGLSPCTRCSSNSFECLYVRSRRGFKGPRRNGTNATPTKASSVPGPVESCPMIDPAARRGASNVPSGLATPPDHRLQTLPRALDLPLYNIGQELVSFEPKPLPSGLDLRERCIESFFYHFYPAHPFILPRDAFFKLRKEKPLDQLEAAMRYVGSFYVPQAPTVALGLEAERTIYHADCPKDGFRIQAMLILAIGLDGYTYQEKALQILLDAQDLALEFGMNKREFAFVNGNGLEILEESWRRTWWELFIVDGMIAGVHQKSTFRMKDIPADVALPCEERDFASGVSWRSILPRPTS